MTGDDWEYIFFHLNVKPIHLGEVFIHQSVSIHHSFFHLWLGSFVLHRQVWPYAAGCVRTYAVANEQKSEIAVAVRSKQAQEFDWALSKLDSSVRRTGRITKTLLLRIFHDICRTGEHSRLLQPKLQNGERQEWVQVPTFVFLVFVFRISQWQPGVTAAS